MKLKVQGTEVSGALLDTELLPLQDARSVSIQNSGNNVTLLWLHDAPQPPLLNVQSFSYSEYFNCKPTEKKMQPVPVDSFITVSRYYSPSIVQHRPASSTKR